MGYIFTLVTIYQTLLHLLHLLSVITGEFYPGPCIADQESSESSEVMTQNRYSKYAIWNPKDLSEYFSSTFWMLGVKLCLYVNPKPFPVFIQWTKPANKGIKGLFENLGNQ